MKIKDFKDRNCVGYLDQIDIHRSISVDIDDNNMFIFDIDDGGPQGASIVLDKKAVEDLINFLIGE